MRSGETTWTTPLVMTSKYQLIPLKASGTQFFALPSSGWSLRTMKNLARAIVYIEEAKSLQALMQHW